MITIHKSIYYVKANCKHFKWKAGWNKEDVRLDVIALSCFMQK